MNRIQIAAAAIVLAVAGLAAPEALAQAKYPERPVVLIVPSPPGGGTDTAARLLAELTEPFLGQKIVVENKAGGGGTVGVAVLSQSKPDGYTLGAVWNSPLTASPHSLPVTYTPEGYTPILKTSSTSYVLCAAPDFPANNGRELIEAIRNSPGKYTYGNDGVGGTMQLAAERIFREAGIKARGVPFGGAGETLKNFLGGQVTFYGGSISPIAPHVQAGKAKCLLVTSADRNPALPQASGLKDVGLESTETVLWRALLGPKDLPADKVAVLESAFRKGAETERFKAFLDQQGEVLTLAGPRELKQLILSELKALGEVAAAIGIKK
jgi:tripartite-type tricarboxylate transporter receptor subunit TctC